MIKISKLGIFYCYAISAIFAVASLPILLNIIVDPFELNNFVSLNINKEKISEKANNPLWKIGHFNPNKTDLVIFGDSRTRALRDKYWQQLGAENTYNFSFTGATMFEIYDSFNFIKTNYKFKTLVIGVQLRSFDEKFKRGMNRVPEALRLYNSPIAYNSNWFISQVGLRLLKDNYFKQYNFNFFQQLFVTKAHAVSLFANSAASTQQLLNSNICINCKLPQDVAPQTPPNYIDKYKHLFADDFGIWSELWVKSQPNPDLNAKFKKQVARNGAADWRYFEFSEKLWNDIEEISIWCQKNGVKLIFIAPPTIVELQHRADEYGFGQLNHILRMRLAKLATIVDFDYSNTLTQNPDNFNDAYHFNRAISTNIISEIIRLVQPSRLQTLEKYSTNFLQCPIDEENIRSKITDGKITVLTGKSCRIWRQNEDA